ncbi:STAS domain-containing protein [Lentzea sp.]|uniref:STAS domain-containing protein n=1 Tax=Lentzea sp. TaxID=56099 RepID=UPI002BA10066|nr:STAS domain-containing protein [Lentzea sp.]HUQ57015.1 STAS domain-containing protein [Lentzea sp.]
MLNNFALPLHVQREVHGLSIVVRAAGEIDQNTVGALTLELRTAIAMATPPFPVVADLSGVTFFGSVGLNELLRHQRRASAAGVPLRIAASQRAVVWPITASGLDQVLELYPDVDQALDVARPARTAG